MEIIVDIDGCDDYEDFDRIIEILRIKHKGLLVQKVDGIDARAAEFLLDGIAFWLVFDDMMGNFLKSENQNGEKKLNNLASEVKEQLEKWYPAKAK